MSKPSSPTVAGRPVRDVMKENILTIAPDQSLRLATQMMLWSSVRHLPVVSDGKLVGMLSDRDLLRAGPLDESTSTVGELMSAPVETIGPDVTLRDAAARLVEATIDCLPIVDGDAVLGLITTTDLLDQMSRSSVPRKPLVRDVMSTMTIRATPDDDVLDVVAMMVREGVRHLPIVDDAGRVVGIVSDRDVRTAIGDPVKALDRTDEDEPEAWPIEAIMTKNPICMSATASIEELAGVLVDESIGAVPVVDEDDRLLGIVSYVDLLYFTYRKSA